MSSWRESDPEPSKPSKPAKPAKPSKPAKPVQATPSAHPSNSSTSRATAWRGKSGSNGDRAKADPAAPAKDWLASDTTEAGFSVSSFRKWTAIGLLFTAFVAATTLFVQWLFYKQPKLPLLAISVGQYDRVPEFRENPFGNQQRSQINAINKKYVFPYKRELNENDNLLGALQSRDWLSNVSLPAELVGLGRPVSAYYINCFAKIDRESIELFHQSSDPFAGDRVDSRSSLDLQNVLESLVGAAPKEKDRYIWVILDLQLPHTVSALGDLSPPWRTAVEKTLNRIKNDHPDNPQLYDRLIVTLPADDGQNNWLAPEYSASFFGYHLFKLLDTPQENASLIRRVLGSTMTLDEFQASLNRKISEDVASRRYAVQTPVWLPRENVQQLNNLGLVGGSRGNFKSEAVEDPKPRMLQIEQLWKKLNDETYRDAYRWDPVGYAKVESQLLALEDYALYQPRSFPDALGATEQALNRLMRPAVGYGVSLIEDTVRADYFCATAFAEQLHKKGKVSSLVAQNEIPVFWMPKDVTNPSSVSQEIGLTEIEKINLVWQTYLTAAYGDSVNWQRVFQRDRLEQALRFLDLNYESEPPPPIEIYLLQRMLDDFDWQRTDDGRTRAEACAKALVTFHQLQTMASNPEPLLTRSLIEPIQIAEADFLLGFDWLLANVAQGQNFPRAIEQFNQSSAQLQMLHTQAQSLAAGIESAQRVLWIAPHMLAWLLREYQFSEDTPQIENDLKDLGLAVQESISIYQHLAKVSKLNLQLPVDGLQLRNQIAAIEQKFRQYVDSKTVFPMTAAASGSSQTFRRNRIALMNPLLKDSERKRLHENVANYLATSSGGENSATADFALTEQRKLRPAIDAFLGPLSSPDSDQVLKELWDRMISTDVRYDLQQQLAAYQEPTASDDIALRRGLMEAELSIRILAGVIGDVPSMMLKTDSQLAWPFSAACWRWKLNETERCVWQVARLSEAGWGNGAIPLTADPSRFYFGLLGNRYLAQIPSLSNPAVSARTEKIIQGGQQRLQDRARCLSQLTIRFGNERQTYHEGDTVQAPVVVGAPPARVGSPGWKAIAAAYLGTKGRPKAWYDPQPDDRVLAVDLGNSAETIEINKSISTRYWKESAGLAPTGVLTVRGNSRTESIPWRSENAPFLPLELTKEIRKDAEIYVDSASDVPVLNVVILLDCSGSMTLKVDAVLESGSNQTTRRQVPLFEQVTDNVRKVVSELAQAHGRREADIRICLMPFGIDQYNKLRSGFLKEFLSERRETTTATTADDWGHFYASDKFWPLNEQGRLQIVRAINDLAGEMKWDTPLYDALLEACVLVQRAQKTTPNATSQILVFSDGVHHVNDGSPYKGRGSKDKVLQQVNSSQARLNIFYYDHFKKWITGQKEQDRAYWEGVEVRGVRELEELRQNDLIDFVQSNDAELLVRKSLETIPGTQIEVRSLQASSKSLLEIETTVGGFRARVPAALLPGGFEVTSRGTRGGAKQRVELTGGERIELKLSGRSSPEFGFPSFDPETNPSGWRSPGQRQRSGGGFMSNVWFRPDWSQPLSFIWKTRHQEHPKSFTTRPLLAVSMISSSQDPKLRPFILADHYFAPGTHFPELRFATVPWVEHTKQTTAQLTLWVADSLPPDLERKMVEQEAGETSLTKGKASIRWKRSGSNLTVDVDYAATPKLEERVVVVCPSSDVAIGKLFTESDNEQYVYTWHAESPNQVVELQITTVAELRSWVTNGLVTELIMDQVDTVN